MGMQESRRSYKRVVKSARPLKQDSKTNKTSSGGLFSKWLIVFVCAMIIGYLIADIICGFKIGQFLPDVLTTSWFAFWSIELINLVVIKRSKIRAQFPDLIETLPDSVNVNLRSGDEFGSRISAVENAVNSANQSSTLPQQSVDPDEFDGLDYSEIENSNSHSQQGGNSQWQNLIY